MFTYLQQQYFCNNIAIIIITQSWFRPLSFMISTPHYGCARYSFPSWPLNNTRTSNGVPLSTCPPARRIQMEILVVAWMRMPSWFVIKRDVLQCIHFANVQQKTTQTICSGGLANESLFAIIMYAYRQLGCRYLCRISYYKLSPKTAQSIKRGLSLRPPPAVLPGVVVVLVHIYLKKEMKRTYNLSI